MTALYALVSAALVGAADFTGALVSRRVPPVRVAAVAQLISIAPAVVCAYLVGWDRVTASDLAWALGSGVSVGLGLMWFYAAMAGGIVSLVAPLVGVIGAVIPVAVAVGRGERPGPLAIAGIVLAIAAIAVASAAPGRGRPDRRTMLLSIGAGVLFGGFYVLYALPSDEAGLWASPLQRIGSAVTLGLLAFPLSGGLRVARDAVSWIAVIALIEVLGGTMLLLAFQRGPVAIATILASLYPVTTVLLAGVVLRERLSASQRVGVALALVAIVLVSAD